MGSIKLPAGRALPEISVAKLGGDEIQLSTLAEAFEWRVIVVYRGKHCPLCTNYLSKLNELLPEFHAIGVDVVAVSADSEEQAQAHIKDLNLSFDVGYALSADQMKSLGLYISDPRSATETDHPFSEPALFVINKKGELQVIDISNAPFARPDPASILMGLKFILNPSNDYPVRGTH